jgi:hypothetical protein
MTTKLSPEEIEKNWKRFRALCEKLGDRSEPVLKMVDALDVRLALCPASGKRDYHNAFAGGLVDHSLRVLGNAMLLVKAFNWEVKKDSLIIGALFHDLGKVGDHENDYYVPQTDQWRIEKMGEEYTFNPNLKFMTVPQRGVFLCQHFGVKLSHDEMLAIILNDGQYATENASYKMKEPMLADIVHIADLISTKQEKGLLP